MTRSSKLKIITCLIFISCVSAHAQTARDAAYADYLFSRGFYTDARSEFLFLSYAAQNPAEKDRFFYRASKSLLESGNYDNAEKELYMIFSSKDTVSEVKNAARFDYLRALYLQKNYFRIESDCASRSDAMPREKMILLWSYLADGNWNGADAVSRSLSENSNDTSALTPDEIAQFRNASLLISKRPDFKIKSPVLAASLSAVFPGAGHLYAGSITNAAGSFLLNSIFITLTAYSWHLKNYPAAALCGFLEIGWYSGNIVSAYQGAELVNGAAERRYKKRVLDNFPYGLGYSFAF